MLNSLAVLVALALSSPAEVTLKTLSGETVAGRLTALSAETAVLAASTGSREFSRAELLAIDGAGLAVNEKPAVWIELVDGSQLLANDFIAADGKAKVELLGGQVLEFPTRAVTAVRFRAQDAALAEQWRAIIAATAAGDQVVRRQVTQRTIEEADKEPQTITETALDPLEGVVLAVGPEIVRFDFGGEQIDVKREKLEGLVYFYSSKRTFPAPLCRLTDASGSRWELKSVQLEQDHLACVSLCGVDFSLPTADLVKLDFSAGNLVYLSELEAENSDPAVSLQPKAMTATFSQLFQLGRKRRFGGEGLSLKGTKEFKAAGTSKKLSPRYSEGIALHATSRVNYRVPDGFRWFKAIAGLDEGVGATGHCRLQIIGDNKELLVHEFDAAQNYLPIELELDISGIRRLTIVVDAGEGIEIGDQINLCEARLTK